MDTGKVHNKIPRLLIYILFLTTVNDLDLE